MSSNISINYIKAYDLSSRKLVKSIYLLPALVYSNIEINVQKAIARHITGESKVEIELLKLKLYLIYVYFFFKKPYIKFKVSEQKQSLLHKQREVVTTYSIRVTQSFKTSTYTPKLTHAFYGSFEKVLILQKLLKVKNFVGLSLIIPGKSYQNFDFFLHSILGDDLIHLQFAVSFIFKHFSSKDIEIALELV